MALVSSDSPHDLIFSGVPYWIIPGHPRYAISKSGSVLSRRGLKPNVALSSSRKRAKADSWNEWRFVGGSPDSDGYLQVVIDGKHGKIHRWMLAVFVRDLESHEVCRHLNGCRSDNRLENLAIGTQKENKADELLHGTRASGEKINTAKLTTKDVEMIMEMRRRHPGASGVSAFLARWFGVDRDAISAAGTGKQWKHVTGGSRQDCGKLSEKEVLAIREMRRRHPGQSGVCVFLAGWFGVSKTVISRAIHHNKLTRARA